MHSLIQRLAQRQDARQAAVTCSHFIPIRTNHGLDQDAGALRKLATFEAAKNNSETAMHTASSD